MCLKTPDTPDLAFISYKLIKYQHLYIIMMSKTSKNKMNVYIQNFTIYVHVLFWSKSYKKNNRPSFNTCTNEQMYHT